tara:strand:+ start:83 stop:490 length:408 start_codon:yes stop_codon:yes gene_type:complete
MIIPKLIVISLIILFCLPLNSYAAFSSYDSNYLKIKNKVINSYSTKFCNAIGIGLSKESAIKLTILENKDLKNNPSLWLDLLNNKSLSKTVIDEELFESVSSKIADKCGYPIGISDKDKIEELKKLFISLYKNIV